MDQYPRIVLITSTRHQDRARKSTDDWRWNIGHIRINEISDTDSTNSGIETLLLVNYGVVLCTYVVHG